MGAVGAQLGCHKTLGPVWPWGHLGHLHGKGMRWQVGTPGEGGDGGDTPAIGRGCHPLLSVTSGVPLRR